MRHSLRTPIGWAAACLIGLAVWVALGAAVFAAPVSINGGADPAGSDFSDGDSYTVGRTVSFSEAGDITHVSVWGTADHVGQPSTVAVYDGTSTSLLTSESVASMVAGWNTVALSSPVTVVVGDPYVVAATSAGYGYRFNTAAGSAGSSGAIDWAAGSGRFIVSPTLAYPSTGSQTSDYGLDLIFDTSGVPPTTTTTTTLVVTTTTHPLASDLADLKMTSQVGVALAISALILFVFVLTRRGR